MPLQYFAKNQKLIYLHYVKIRLYLNRNFNLDKIMKMFKSITLLMPISMSIAFLMLITISMLIAMDHMFMFMFIVLLPNFADIALASMKLLDS